MNAEQSEHELRQLLPAELSQVTFSRLQAAVHAARSEACEIAHAEATLRETSAPVDVTAAGMSRVRSTLLKAFLRVNRCREHRQWRRYASAAACVLLSAGLTILFLTMPCSDEVGVCPQGEAVLPEAYTAIAQRRIVPCDMPPPPPHHHHFDAPHHHHAPIPPFYGEPHEDACGHCEYNVIYHDSILFKDTDNTVLYISVPNAGTVPFEEVI